MKIGHDLARKKFVPESGRSRGWVFSKFMDWFEPINFQPGNID